MSMSEETSFTLCASVGAIAFVVCIFFWAGCERQNKEVQANMTKEALAKGCSVVAGERFVVICPAPRPEESAR